MVRRTLTVAVVLALLCPLPLFISPGPGEISVSLDTGGWGTNLLSPPGLSMNVTVVETQDLSDGEKLTYISLQGLRNKREGSVYLIQTEMDRFWLSVLVEQYGIRPFYREPAEFARESAGIPLGFVVVDPEKKETVNVATTISGLMNYVIVYPSKVERFKEVFGHLPIIDLRLSPWKERTGMAVYTYAFNEYFSDCNVRFMGFFPEWIDFGRDLLIANSVFAFYATPGPFSDPFAWEELRGILRVTPHTHALVGSIEPYIAAEEDFAIRDFSVHGKYFIPTSRVPNLSILSTFPQTEDVDMGEGADGEVVLENKHYVAIGVEDGDNIAFLHDRMAKGWLSSERGELPLTWSISPYAGEFAPPFLDYYYSTKSSKDAFMMAPSGAGLVFPGFLPEGALDRYMQLTEGYVDDLNFSFAWVLNSYRTYEVDYSDELLDRYARMGFQGLVLDYDDMPWHDQYVIAGDRDDNAPAVRSTQLWESVDNLQAKMDVAKDAYPERPLFTMLAYNPWSISLGELGDVLDDLDCEVVSMATFFELIRLASIEDAERAIAAFESVPTSFFFGTLMDSAEDHLDRAETDGGVNAYEAWTARRKAELGLGLSLALLLAILVFAIAGMMAFLTVKRGKGPPGLPAVTRVVAMTLVFTAFALLYYRVLFSETWSLFPLTATIFIVPVVGGLLTRRGRHEFLTLGSALFIGGALGCYFSWWAFPAFAFGTFLLLDRTGNGHMDEMAVSLSLGLTLALLIPRDLGTALSLALLAPLVIALSDKHRDERIEGGASVFAGVLLAMLVVGSVLQDSRYMVQRFDYFPLALATVMIVIPVLGLIVGWAVMETRVKRFGFSIGLGAFALSWALVPYLESLMVLSLLILVQQSGIVMMVLETARRGPRREGPMYPALAISFFVFFNMAFYTTPVILDVYFVTMGYWVNYVLYHHALFFVLLAGVLLLSRALERSLFGWMVSGFQRFGSREA
jgi:hypothetical protein